jgi:hypothetical protein
VRGCRVHRWIARRARRLGSRRASHLVDVERKRSCTGSVHSSGSFCTKLRLLALRTPPSWLAAGAPDQMPAARGPAMHQAMAQRCTKLGPIRKASATRTGRRLEDVGKRRAQAFFCGENRIGFSGPYSPLLTAYPLAGNRDVMSRSPGCRLCSLMNRQSTNAKFTTLCFGSGRLMNTFYLWTLAKRPQGPFDG